MLSKCTVRASYEAAVVVAGTPAAFTYELLSSAFKASPRFYDTNASHSATRVCPGKAIPPTASPTHLFGHASHTSKTPLIWCHLLQEAFRNYLQ